MENITDAPNGSEICFTDHTGQYAKIRNAKDNWGNVTGVKVVDKSGDEFKVVKHDGDVCITAANAVAAVPKPVGKSIVMTEADWFAYEVGGYTVEA